MTEEPVRLVPYDPAWPARFEAERAALADVLAPWLAGPIEHIGSTAVPDLIAKPTIDIMAGVRDLPSSLGAIPVLRDLEYNHFPYRADVMHWFCKPSLQRRQFHLHLVPVGSDLWLDRLAFRNFLRRSGDAAADYAALKTALAAKYPTDREAYTDAKGGFVNSILERARTAMVTVAVLTLGATAAARAQQPQVTLDAPTAGRFAALALACVQQEYPNKIAHVLNSPADVKAPHELTPAFYGCFDWHSAVHGHWLLARLVREFPSAPFAAAAMAALQANLTPAHIAGEVAYFNGPGRESFERPYGLAWLLQLAAELRESGTPAAAALSSALKPLEEAVVARLEAWLPKLAYPIREGEHAQTAFAFGLILDYARGTNPELAALVATRVREYHVTDRDCPINYEPSGQDFLSPCIAEADVMRRVLPPPEFAAWLTTFLPGIPVTDSGAWLPIGVVTDQADGKLAHLDGLNLSRAWMLQGIAAGLPATDPRRRALLAAADMHAASGLAAVTGEHYAGGHWLGSFATYLTTRRGIASSPGGTQEGR